MRLLLAIAFLLSSACASPPQPDRAKASAPKPESRDPCSLLPPAAHNAAQEPKDGLPEVTVETARIKHLKDVILVWGTPNGDMACVRADQCAEGFDQPRAACRRIGSSTQYHRCLLQMAGDLPVTPEDCLPPVELPRNYVYGK